MLNFNLQSGKLIHYFKTPSRLVDMQFIGGTEFACVRCKGELIVYSCPKRDVLYHIPATERFHEWNFKYGLLVGWNERSIHIWNFQQASPMAKCFGKVKAKKQKTLKLKELIDLTKIQKI